MGKRYDKAIREEILSKIRGGRGVKEVSEEYGVHELTVRGWLKCEVTSSSATLEVSRLKRENETLYRLLGQLVYESERGKKIRRGSSKQ
jgi:transposase-like protein